MVQVDVMYVQVYKTIGLSNEQRRFLADFWATWTRRREQLDRVLADALRRAAALPSAACISPDLTALLDRAVASPPREHVVPLCPLDPDDPDAPPPLPPHTVPRHLLGMSVRCTTAAADAVHALVDVLHRDARQMEDFASEFVLPQWFMTAAQRARLNCSHVRHACVPMEMLVVCRMAAAEQRRHLLARPMPRASRAAGHTAPPCGLSHP